MIRATGDGEIDLADDYTIVVGVGLTGESGYVLEKVVGLAGDPSRIVAAHVLEHTQVFYDDAGGYAVSDSVLQSLEADASERLGRLCQRFGVDRFEVRLGHPPTVLHEIAERHGARLIAIGTHGRQGWRALLGETANAVLHGTRTNVLAILTRDDLPKVSLAYRRLLVAVDLSTEAAAVVDAARRVADRFDSSISVVSVIRPLTHVYHGIDVSNPVEASRFDDIAAEQTREGLRELLDACGLADATAYIRRGEPRKEIHLLADELDADLIVLGTHGTHGPALLLGSTPNAVLHGVRRDVLAVRVGLEEEEGQPD